MSRPMVIISPEFRDVIADELRGLARSLLTDAMVLEKAEPAKSHQLSDRTVELCRYIADLEDCEYVDLDEVGAGSVSRPVVLG